MSTHRRAGLRSQSQNAPAPDVTPGPSQVSDNDNHSLSEPPGSPPPTSVTPTPPGNFVYDLTTGLVSDGHVGEDSIIEDEAIVEAILETMSNGPLDSNCPSNGTNHGESLSSLLNIIRNEVRVTNRRFEEGFRTLSNRLDSLDQYTSRSPSPSPIAYPTVNLSTVDRGPQIESNARPIAEHEPLVNPPARRTATGPSVGIADRDHQQLPHTNKAREIRHIRELISRLVAPRCSVETVYTCR